MTHRQQVLLWLIGVNVHKRDTGECTPDFSCCREQRFNRTSFRVRFCFAHDYLHKKNTDGYLINFLANMIGQMGFTVTN